MCKNNITLQLQFDPHRPMANRKKISEKPSQHMVYVLVGSNEHLRNSFPTGIDCGWNEYPNE